MSEEIRAVLRMVADRKISPEEGERLLDVLHDGWADVAASVSPLPSRPPVPPRAPTAPEPMPAEDALPGSKSIPAEPGTALRIEAKEFGALSIVHTEGNDVVVDGAPESHYRVVSKPGEIVVQPTRHASRLSIAVPGTVTALHVRADHMDVSAMDLRASLETIGIHTDTNGIHARLMRRDQGSVEITSDTGGVDLEIDPGASVELTAAVTDNGDVQMDMPMEARTEGPGFYNGCMNGGGARVRLKTDNGGIRVRAAERGDRG